MYAVQLDERAKLELEEGLEWYSARSKPVAQRFFDTTLSCLLSLQITPKRFAIRYDKVRMAMVKRFPYAIHYQVFDDRKLVLVLAILHASRNPKSRPKTK